MTKTFFKGLKCSHFFFSFFQNSKTERTSKEYVHRFVNYVRDKDSIPFLTSSNKKTPKITSDN